ncbi:histidinol-phosphatase HisJ family protein [Christensenellaceae bacterium OttesenSCG-928-M15]|nr:histidinol-phosphatase HisJ family protein [Christensenellaceae bacterium OttesenSCG-928-M15]
MLIDYHMHSALSPDSPAPVMAQIEAAKGLGLTEICFTEHLEVNYPNPAWVLNANEYDAAREKHEGQDGDLKVRFGLEAGISCPDEDKPALRSLVFARNPDYVTASVHTMRGENPDNTDLYSSKPASEIHRMYIRSILRNLKLVDDDMYNCVSHFDWMAKMVARRVAHADTRLSYEAVADEIDALFSYVIERGKCIEINTSSFIVPGESDSMLTCLRRYRALGGEYVMFGSDAHQPARVGEHIAMAMELAKAAGITRFATFNRMRPVFHSL